MSTAEDLRMLPVTKTFLPPMAEYLAYLQGIWETARVTTLGPLACQLTQRLERYLEVDHLLFVASGTSALQVAIEALQLGNEIITTPFTYVATVSSIAWTGRRPVLVDIDPETLAIDARQVEAAITSRTSAILATHVYGYPCDVDALQDVARRHGIKLLFDAAACFGVRYRGRSLVQYGDVSTLSFHATKVFHTVEGGGIVSPNALLHEACVRAHNQGHKGLDRGFEGVGTNAKNSELHAAMGLSVLPYVPELIAWRRRLSEIYDQHLADVKRLRRPHVLPETESNYTYYPLIFPSELTLLTTQRALAERQIMTRRYFYPSLTTLDYVAARACPHATDIARRVLCLPLAHAMSLQDVAAVAGIVRDSL
jgi:dTDP-4-amino-4,6-dideoxygalactose transaminase